MKPQVADWSTALALWRRLALAQLRQQPLRLWLSLLTIAAGVALCTAVWLINSSALQEFNRAGRRLAGDAELSIRGPAAGFAESLYADLARDPAVQLASPMLELELALADRRGTLHVLGLDPLRAAPLQPALLAELAGESLQLLTGDGLYLSAAAALQLQLQRGDELAVLIGAQRVLLPVLGVLSDTAAAPLGLMDIATAQWRLQRLGVINRIDLRLIDAVDARSFGATLQRRLPAGVIAVTPATADARMASATLAYRVNLNLLALVSLLTGTLLLLAAQSLSLLQRRSSLALLRALGMTRGELQWALAGEGVVLGVLGSLVGVLLGQLASAALLGWIDDGPGMQGLTQRLLQLHPLAWVGFVLLGTTSATLGAWLPAREAARRAPALALKAGDAAVGSEGRHFPRLGVLLLAIGASLAWLPAVANLPVFGYLAIALLLLGGLLLAPAVCGWLLAHAPRSGQAVFDIGLAQLRGSGRQIALNLGAVIVSFSLMIAMAIMVYSFRESFERWLQQSLPADLQLRTNGDDTRALSVDEQQQLARLPGVARADFTRNTQLLLRADRLSVTLSARDAVSDAAAALPLQQTAPAPAGARRIWISEAMQALYGMQPGAQVELPVGGGTRWFVAGVFRDYGRPGGAIVMPRNDYLELTGDRGVDQAALWLVSRADADAVIAAARTLSESRRGIELRATPELRAGLLRGFDRAFAITYLLEAAAVLIGLAGVALAGAAAATARRGEFGMLRHLGMLRRQIVAMLAGEGLLLGAVGMLYGLVLGSALSLVLVYVVNRQSFNWSIDLAIPWWQLGALCAALLAAATMANLLSARTALGVGALRAVREDW